MNNDVEANFYSKLLFWNTIALINWLHIDEVCSCLWKKFVSELRILIYNHLNLQYEMYGYTMKHCLILNKFVNDWTRK